MKLKLFRLPKNKHFNYTPHYYEGKEEGNAFEMGSRIRKDHEAISNHFTKQWRGIRSESRNRKNAQFNKTFWIAPAILVLLPFYFLDFDLSTFLRKQNKKIVKPNKRSL